MRISVTGASGAIGSRLCTHLAQAGFEVRALVRPGSVPKNLYHRSIEIIAGDVTVPGSMAGFVAGSHSVIHAAGLKKAARERTLHRQNVTGTSTLADACHQHEVQHLIYISSLAAQGPSERGRPHRHGGNEAPCNPYGYSKLAAEGILKKHPIAPRTTVIRPGLIYGPDASALIPWIRWVGIGIVPVVPSMQLSFLYLDDLVRTLSFLIPKQASFGPHFLVSSPPVLMANLVDLIEGQLEQRPAVRLFTNRRLLKFALGPMQKASASLGVAPGVTKVMNELSEESWAVAESTNAWLQDQIPFTPMEEGIRALIEWCRQTGRL
ncbi:MAG: NAD-dependent epimerase/dehydratase family protein [Myxococcota bacterium]|nr:NAD-dependent epimerase/dehydratase family protein [Myxococcota bacterium]